MHQCFILIGIGVFLNRNVWFYTYFLADTYIIEEMVMQGLNYTYHIFQTRAPLGGARHAHLHFYHET